MSAYIFSITGMIVVCCVLGFLFPNGKMTTLLKGVMRITCLIVLFSPLFNLDQFDFESFTTSINVQNKYLIACKERLEIDVKDFMEECLNKEELTGDIEVFCSDKPPFRVEKAIIKISNDGIYDEGAHIDKMTKLKTNLEEALKCQVEIE